MRRGKRREKDNEKEKVVRKKGRRGGGITGKKETKIEKAIVEEGVGSWRSA